jgi:hypothetical protein
MSLIISLLYLMLNIMVILFVAAALWWLLKWIGIGIDPLVLKFGQAIVALLVLILIVSWLAGALPPHGIFGRLSQPADVPFRLVLPTFA